MGNPGHYFNIAINARVDWETVDDAEVGTFVATWGEDAVRDQPLGTELFVDADHFETTLDRWLAAFLAAMGVTPSPGTPAPQIRRIAARRFGIFDVDVPHDELFPLARDGEDS